MPSMTSEEAIGERGDARTGGERRRLRCDLETLQQDVLNLRVPLLSLLTRYGSTNGQAAAFDTTGESLDDSPRRPSAVTRFTSLLSSMRPKLAMKSTMRKLSATQDPHPTHQGSKSPRFTDHLTERTSAPIWSTDAATEMQMATPTDTLGSQAASELLGCFAPPIRSLQTSSKSLQVQFDIEQTDRERFMAIGRSLLEQLTSAQEWARQISSDKKANDGSHMLDSHDHEMIQLVLTALVKKVETEMTAIAKHTELGNRVLSKPEQPRVPDGFRESSGKGGSPISSLDGHGSNLSSPVTITLTNPTHSHPGSRSIAPSISSLLQRSLAPTPGSASNPFIVHSTSIFAPVRPRAPSQTPKRIGAPPLSGTSSSYATFVSGSQMSTRHINDIVRLGSLQNSVLFSPSPVAVRGAWNGLEGRQIVW